MEESPESASELNKRLIDCIPCTRVSGPVMKLQKLDPENNVVIREVVGWITEDVQLQNQLYFLAESEGRYAAPEERRGAFTERTSYVQKIIQIKPGDYFIFTVNSLYRLQDPSHSGSAPEEIRATFWERIKKTLYFLR